MSSSSPLKIYWLYNQRRHIPTRSSRRVGVWSIESLPSLLMSGFDPVRFVVNGVALRKILRRLVIRRLTSVNECTYTDPDSIAYCTASLYGIAYCCQATNLYSVLLYWILQGNCNTMVLLYYNIMGPSFYMRSVVDRNVVMRRITALGFFQVTVIAPM